MSKSEINGFIRQHFHSKTDQEVADLLAAQGIKISGDAVRKRRKSLGLIKDPSHTTDGANKLGTLANLLTRNGIDIDEIASIQRVKMWQTTTKDENGEAEQHDNVGIQFTPKWADGPAWPVVQQAEPVKFPAIKLQKREKWGKTCVILPDPQFGFRRDMVTDELDPFHDEKAISVAMQIVRDEQPEVIVNIGDLLDLAEFSRFVGEAGFARTTQASINRAHRFLAEQRHYAPDAEIILFSGNHEKRIETWIKTNGMAAFGLQRANEPEAWPVMSIPFLLRLEELNIKYIDGYPAGSYYLNDRLKFIHGDKTGKRGTVANKVVSSEKVSTITGHTHGLEMVYHTVDTQRGPRTRFGATMGCLCRIDGGVPSTKGGQDSFGRPVKRYEDWQQAVGIVTYMDGDNPFALEHAYIHEGFAIFRGKPYFADTL